MRSSRWLAPLAGALGIIAVAGCGSPAMANQMLGPTEPPAGYSSTTVQQLVQEDRWHDQKVVFEGAISKIGCVGCGGVIVADKTWRISAEPEDPSRFRIPVRAGAPLKIWGVLRVTEDGFREVKAHRVEFLSVKQEGAR